MTAVGDSRDAEAGQARRRRPGGGKRRLSSIVILLSLVAILGIVTATVLSSLSLQAGTARAEIEDRLSELSGMAVEVGGDASFSLLPKTQLALTDIRIISQDEAGDAAMQIDAIVADLALWPALFGRTEIKRLSILRPELLSTGSFMRRASDREAEDGANPASGKSRRLTAVEAVIEMDPSTRERYDLTSRFLGAFLSRFGELDSVEIRDGVFRIDPAGGSLGISNASVTLSWPSKEAPARMSGSYVWNGQPTDLDVSLVSPLSFLSGEASDIDFELTSPPLSIEFDGRAATGGIGRFSGVLKVGTPSLGRSIRWLSDPRAVFPDLGPMSIEATVDGVGSNLALRNATVSLDGFEGSGSVEMAVADGRRPSLGGTLAFERLNLSNFTRAIAPLPATPFDLQRRLSVDFVDHLDLDLRLSAAAGEMGSVPFADLAATIKFKDGIATFDVGDASLLGGSGQARLSVDSRAASPRAVGFAGVTGIEASGLFAALGITTVGMSGTSDISAEIDTPVTNWGELFRRNRMKISVDARDGALSGFDPTVFLSEGTRPFALATQPTAIPFRSLRAELSSTGPRLAIEAVTLSGDVGAFEAKGVLSTATNTIDVKGSFLPGPSSRTAQGSLATSKPIGFTMSGEWPRPTVVSRIPAKPI